KLLDRGEAPAVHVPAAEVRTWREGITGRGRVIAQRTRAKNSLRARLRCAGGVPPGRPALWTKKGLEWLRRRGVAPAAPQGGSRRGGVRRGWPRGRGAWRREEIGALTRQAGRMEENLNQQANPAPAVLRLRSIPGVGVRTAEAVAAFVDHPHRSRDAKAVGR